MKMCEQILKKRQRPNTIQILWKVKNQEKANNSPSYRCAAINKKIIYFFKSVSAKFLLSEFRWVYKKNSRRPEKPFKNFTAQIKY